MNDKEIFLRVGYLPDFDYKHKVNPSGHDFSPSEVEDEFLGKLPEGKNVAVLLSGGLDSSLVAWALKERGNDVTAFTAAYDIEQFEAEKVAYTLGIELRKVDITEEGCWDIFEDYVKACPLPSSEWSGLVLAQLMKEVKYYGFDEVYTGDCGDDLFGGYIYFKKLYDLEKGLVDAVKTPRKRALRFYGFLRDIDNCPELDEKMIPYIESFFEGNTLTGGLSDFTVHNWLNRGMIPKNQGAEKISGVKIIAPLLELAYMANKLPDHKRVDKWMIRELLKRTPISFVAEKAKLGFKPPIAKGDFVKNLMEYRKKVWKTRNSVDA